MKKKRTQTVESTTVGGRREAKKIPDRRGGSKKFQTEARRRQKGQKVEKECSGWTTGGLEHQDGAERP